MEKEEESDECEIMGHEVNIENIENPHIRKAIEKRNSFLFNYSEHEDYQDYQEKNYGDRDREKAGEDFYKAHYYNESIDR